MGKRVGSQSFILESMPRIISSASFVGDKEGKGPLGGRFDTIVVDDTLGLNSWEQAESRMLESAVRLSLAKIDKKPNEIDFFMGGDLLNQIISAGYAARELRAPFLGLYVACSTISEGLLIGSMLTDGGFSSLGVCGASSHFSSAERQFRFPLEMGTQPTPTSQRTVTGAGAIVVAAADTACISSVFEHIRLTGGTIGKVADFGITDANNMGAAMAPAAAATICAHMQDNSASPDDFDAIITGDLGAFGSDMLYELCNDRGIDIQRKHVDCGKLMFSTDQNVNCGASGCGCAATVLSSHILPMVEKGDYSRILFMATGALMSTVATMQGESIPSIAHAVVIERI